MTKHYDYSHGSSNRYTVTTARHGWPVRCAHCNDDTEVTLDGAEFFNYQNLGQFVQVAFPTLDADQRDLLSVGIHPECSDAYYGVES